MLGDGVKRVYKHVYLCLGITLCVSAFTDLCMDTVYIPVEECVLSCTSVCVCGAAVILSPSGPVVRHPGEDDEGGVMLLQSYCNSLVVLVCRKCKP